MISRYRIGVLRKDGPEVQLEGPSLEALKTGLYHRGDRVLWIEAYDPRNDEWFSLKDPD